MAKKKAPAVTNTAKAASTKAAQSKTRVSAAAKALMAVGGAKGSTRKVAQTTRVKGKGDKRRV